MYIKKIPKHLILETSFIILHVCMLQVYLLKLLCMVMGLQLVDVLLMELFLPF